MIAQIDFILKKAGYHYISVKPKEAGVYYKLVDSIVYVVIGIADHKDFVTNPKQLEAIQTRVRELFMKSHGKIEGFPKKAFVTQIFMQMIIITNRSSYYKEAVTQVKGIWFIDEQAKKLVIYENQPGNFLGLKEEIEEMLFRNKKAKSTAKNPWWKQLFHPSKNIAFVTIGLIVINFLVFIGMSLFGDTNNAQFLWECGGLYLPSILLDGQWYRFFTSMFIHSGFLHILNNMFILYFTGEILELAVGKVKYSIIYLLSGLGGGILSLLVSYLTQNVVVSVGASGAIFGVIGGLLWIVIAHKGRYQELTSYRMLIMIVLILFIGFTSTQIDNWGHIGGLLTGFVTSVLLYHRKKSRSKQKD